MKEKNNPNKLDKNEPNIAQVQVRLTGQTREALEAALAHLQITAGVQVQRWPRQGRKGEWLVYATLNLPVQSAARPTSG